MLATAAERFTALADAEGVCFGEFFEKALDAYVSGTGLLPLRCAALLTLGEMVLRPTRYLSR